MSNTKVVVALSQKGGACKTFTTVNLAGALPGRVAIIDTDPQLSASKWSKRRVRNGISELPYTTTSEVDDLPRLIRNVRAENVDWVLVDTRGTTGPEMVEFARMADVVMIPSKIDGVDVDSARDTIRLLSAPHMPPHFIVLACVRRGVFGIDSSANAAASALRKAGGNLAPLMISDLKAFKSAFDTGRTVQEFAPRSQGCRDIEDLAKFTQAILA